jgi:hypothetical protein
MPRIHTNGLKAKQQNSRVRYINKLLITNNGRVQVPGTTRSNIHQAYTPLVYSKDLSTGAGGNSDLILLIPLDVFNDGLMSDSIGETASRLNFEFDFSSSGESGGKLLGRKTISSSWLVRTATQSTTAVRDS